MDREVESSNSGHAFRIMGIGHTVELLTNVSQNIPNEGKDLQCVKLGSGLVESLDSTQSLSSSKSSAAAGNPPTFTKLMGVLLQPHS
jgi:hypothetical protein